jgi:hypothetical protein
MSFFTKVFVAVDYQEGLFNLARDILPQKLKSNLLGHASLAALFHLPIVLTTTADTGPNGPIMKEIRDMHPDALLVRCTGEVNAFDNSEFRAVLKATGRKQGIIGALLTEVCMWIQFRTESNVVTDLSDATCRQHFSRALSTG